MLQTEAADKVHLELLEKHFRSEYSDMLSFASYLLNNRSLAETAVQDTFVFAIENIEKFKASPNQIGWLYSVLKNIVRHTRRDQQMLLKKVVSIEAAPELMAVSGSETKMFSLPEGGADFALLIKFYIHGYSLKELADEHGISVGACKMRIKRAKERMKKEYEKF